MKFKIIIGIFALLSASLVGVYLYATNEEVQREFVQKILEESTGAKVGFENLEIDLSSAKIKSLELNSEEYNFFAEEIALSYESLFSLFFDELNIEELNLINSSLELLNKEPEISTGKEVVARDSEDIQAKKQVKAIEVLPAQKENISVANSEKPPSNLVISIAKINADIIIKNEDERLAKVEIKANDFLLTELKDLKNLRLEAKIEEGLFYDDILLSLQLKENDDLRNLQALLSYKGEESLKFIANYSPDFKILEVLSSAKISEENLALKSLKNSGIKLDFYLDAKSYDFFENIEAKLSLDGESKYLSFASKELNLLSNSKLKLNTEFKKEQEAISIEKLDGELSQEGETLAILKLNKAIDISLDNQDLKDFASLYIDRIPYSIISSYLPEYEFSDNKLKAHLNLSFDTENTALIVDTKEEIYFEAVEIIKNEAILISDIFLAGEFSAKIDLKNNLSAMLKLRLIEESNKEMKAEISLEKNTESLSANINAKGDALTILNHAQAHIDNVEKIRNSKLDLNASLLCEGEKLEISNLKLKLFDADFELFEVQLSEALSFKNFELQNDVLKAKIYANALPFTPFKSFVKDIDATSISCDIDVEKSAEKINAKGFLSLENLSYLQEGEKILGELYPKISFKLETKGDDIKTEIERLGLSYNGVEIARGSAQIDANLNAENFIAKAKGNIALYLASLVQLPAFKEDNNIQTGYAEVVFSFKDSLLDIKSKITNLKLYSEESEISALNIEAKSDIFAKDKNLDLNLMIASPRGQSFATLTNIIEEGKISTKLSSEKIILEDFIFLSKAFAKREKSSTPQLEPRTKASKEKLSLAERKARAMQAAQASTQKAMPAPIIESPKNTPPKKTEVIPDKIAFWDIGYKLDLDANIKSLAYSHNEILSNLNTQLSLDEKSVRSKKLSFNFVGSREAKGGFSLVFDKTFKEVYNLENFDLRVKGINMAHATLDPYSGISTMEGFLDLDVVLGSTASNPEGLLDNLRADLKLNNAGNGLIHFIKADSQIGAMSDIASTFIGIASGFLGDTVKEIKAANILLDVFKSFNYTKLFAHITRGDSKHIKLENLEIEGSDIFIYGKGGIKHDERLALSDQELGISLDSYVQDRNVATLFNKLNLMKAKSDRKNLYQGPTFYIYGSLNDVQTNIEEVLSNSATGTATNIIDTLFK